MNNNTKNPRRGRPSFEVNLPDKNKFTINDLHDANPHITCRLTLYSKRNQLVKTKQIVLTREKVPTGSVGKPLAVYAKAAFFARSKAARKEAKCRKNVENTAPETAPKAAPVSVETAVNQLVETSAQVFADAPVAPVAAEAVTA